MMVTVVMAVMMMMRCGRLPAARIEVEDTVALAT